MSEGKKRSLGAFLTGAADEVADSSQREPRGRPAAGPRADNALKQPPSSDRRRPTRVARPVSAKLPSADVGPVRSVSQSAQPQAPLALPDHQAPPGAVLVAGVDENGVEYVLEDDPDAMPLVDPGYDEDDDNWVRYSPSWGGIARVVLFILAALLLVFMVRSRIYGWIDDQVSPGGDPGAFVDISIPSGTSTNNVATLLEDEGVISNATVFRYWLRCEGDLTISGFLGCDTDRTFLAGDYELQENMSFEAVVAKLDEGPIPEVFVNFTIPEGLRVTELADRLLSVNSNFDRDDLNEALADPALVSKYGDPNAPLDKRLEGTLFPATYDVAEEDVADEAKFLKRMASTFDQRYESVLADVGKDPVIEELGLSDYDIIIIASLIEKEARVDVDRPLMARGIYNRLAQGERLRIDASVYYAFNKSFTETIFQSELDTPSPWNTYQTDGLPPTPISAPGEKALRAALAPADGDHIFWARTDANGLVGAHTFSVTSEDHDAAVAVCIELGYCG